jgi:antitoxin HigA-1
MAQRFELRTMNMHSGFPPIHPGEYLAELLEELRISRAALARILGVSPMRISHIVNCGRPVTAEMALLLGKAFVQTPGYWMNLQSSYDLKSAEAKLAKRLKSVRSIAVD